MEWRFGVTLTDSDQENIWKSNNASPFRAKGHVLIFALVWALPDFVKWHNSLLDDIILKTKAGQVYIFSNSQKVQFNLVRQDSLVSPKGPIFHCQNCMLLIVRAA